MRQDKKFVDQPAVIDQISIHHNKCRSRNDTRQIGDDSEETIPHDLFIYKVRSENRYGKHYQHACAEKQQRIFKRNTHFESVNQIGALRQAFPYKLKLIKAKNLVPIFQRFKRQ
jgi:hypothetical protein